MEVQLEREQGATCRGVCEVNSDIRIMYVCSIGYKQLLSVSHFTKLETPHLYTPTLRQRQSKTSSLSHSQGLQHTQPAVNKNNAVVATPSPDVNQDKSSESNFHSLSVRISTENRKVWNKWSVVILYRIPLALPVLTDVSETAPVYLLTPRKFPPKYRIHNP